MWLKCDKFSLFYLSSIDNLKATDGRQIYPSYLELHFVLPLR